MDRIVSLAIAASLTGITSFFFRYGGYPAPASRRHRGEIMAFISTSLLQALTRGFLAILQDFTVSLKCDWAGTVCNVSQRLSASTYGGLFRSLH